MYARRAYAFRVYAYKSYALSGAEGALGTASLSEQIILSDAFIAVMTYKPVLAEALTLSDFEGTVIRMPIAETLLFADSFVSRKGWIPEIPLPKQPWVSE